MLYQTFSELRSIFHLPSSPAPAPSPPQAIGLATAPVLLCIDLEAYELDQSQITEIGLSTLDTRDILGLSPGTSPAAWLAHMRTTHILIAEHRHLVNGRYVAGCPDKFLHGTSQAMSLAEAQRLVVAAFKAPGVLRSTREPEERDILLVGHGVRDDVRYLSSIGISDIPSRVIDTQRLCSSKRRPVGLAKLLDALQMEYSWLHNAGNDAAFTLEALLRLVWLYGFDEVALRGVMDRLGAPMPPGPKARKNEAANAAAAAAATAAQTHVDGA
ncbi:hypothetical protein ANO11243_079210 [Dothideomycetidae sp. 11243]|nr:hypothetical protein ANO11243_079210 [fungal sp. No.11243]